MTKTTNSSIQGIIDQMIGYDECLTQLDRCLKNELNYDDINFSLCGMSWVYGGGMLLAVSTIEKAIMRNLKKLHKSCAMDENEWMRHCERYAIVLGKQMYQMALMDNITPEEIPDELLHKFQELLINYYKCEFGLVTKNPQQIIRFECLVEALESLERTWREYYNGTEMYSDVKICEIVNQQMSEMPTWVEAIVDSEC